MPSTNELSDTAGATSDRFLRHDLTDRLLHWAIAACMFALLATGLLPIFGFKFNWVAPHWIVGLALTVAVLLHTVRAFTALSLRNMWVGMDEIVDSVSAELNIVGGKYVEPAKTGKYSVAQKLFHFAMSSIVLLAIATGIVMMAGIDTPFWERNPYVISEATRGVVFVIHGFATLMSITLIIVHVYFAFRPEKRYFLRSMVRGWITRTEYAEHHDPELWNVNDQ